MVDGRGFVFMAQMSKFKKIVTVSPCSCYSYLRVASV